MSYESEDTARQHLNQYKIGKAYQYFKSEWLKEVYYHPVDRASLYCFLRAKCTPSQSLRSDAHTAWICCEKASGDIKSAYCTCTAGYGQTCNHVAGLLFRVEYANKMGYTSCTSSKCEWVVPKERSLEPAMIKDMTFERSQHGKAGKTRPPLGHKKRDYNPLPQTDDSRVTEHNESEDDEFFSTFTDELRKSLPNACLFKGIDIDASQGREEVQQVLEEQPDIDQGIYTELPTQTGEDVNDFLMENAIDLCVQSDSTEKISPSSISMINKSTVGQAKNESWHAMRKGRITSSNFYSIHTKVATIKKKTAVTHDVKPLLKNIMGYRKINPNVKSLKYGREMEPVAKSVFLKEFSTKHKNVNSEECGIIVDAVRPFIAASPDLLLSCACCGDGCLEIKCPLIGKCQSCQSFCTCNVPHCLRLRNYCLSLKHEHSYYAQIQGQMHVSGRRWCDFFVYTCNGNYTERVYYDETYFAEIVRSLDFFFFSYVLPEIKSNCLKNENDEEEMDVDEEKENIVGDTYFCPCCNELISRVVQSLRERSVCCNVCGLWYHYRCVNLTEAKVKKISSWHCEECSM
ncbi:hypothetical protein FSP39_000663 [Pinctada imbricata]|uniref:Uncharacterized protein n=1 Tax=Pinctada imbricata TaxID=66713 RepID=A0AA88YQ52_PINIB|nr:hypothetical protein FSP39_000663 [Pinctada imbricata]